MTSVLFGKERLIGDTASMYWTHLSWFHLKTDTECSLRNTVFWINDSTMDIVENCDSYVIQILANCMLSTNSYAKNYFEKIYGDKLHSESDRGTTRPLWSKKIERLSWK
jgi:hypothetical protein